MLTAVVSVTLFALAALGVHMSTTREGGEVAKEKQAPAQSYMPFFTGFRHVYRSLIFGIIALEGFIFLLQDAASNHQNPKAAQYADALANWIGNSLPYRDGRLPSVVTTSLLLNIIGASFRVWGQRTLGSFHTWEIGIQATHQLCTIGPYAIVRHPTYTGFIVHFAGQCMFVFSKHTFLRQCLWKAYPIATIGALCFLGIYMLLAFVVMIQRTGQEDHLLKEKFGEEWELWAEKTRSKLVPRVY